MTISPRVKDLEDIKAVFDKFGVRFFIVYGAVLGFHRDKGFLPDDDDIDIAIIDPISHETRKAIGWMLHDLGFYPQGIHTGEEIMFNVYNRMEPLEVGYNGDAETGIIVVERNFKFTIFFFKEEDCPIHGEEYVCVPKLGAVKLIATPKKFYVKPDSIVINKKSYLVPGPMKDYLDFSYFNNWKDKSDRRHSPTYPEAHQNGNNN